MNTIPLAVPHIHPSSGDRVLECLKTNWVSYAGPFVDEFEAALAQVTGSQHAVAMASGTAALHIALLLAGVEAGDEVIMPGLSFVAPANAIRYCNAWPWFTDIGMDDWQWDIDKLEEFLRKGCKFNSGRLINRQTGRRIAALLPVHLLGGMCDIDGVISLAQEFDLPVVEDAAECLGALYKQQPIGFQRGLNPDRHLVATSFNGNKIITTGGGGAILTYSEKLAVKAKHLSTTAKVRGLNFYHDTLGYNYRLTNLAAALGLSQLEHLNEHVSIKRTIAQQYQSELSGLGITLHPEPMFCESTYWMYTVMLNCESTPIIEFMNQHGIMVRPLWVPLSNLPAFIECDFTGDLCVVQQLYKTAISLPCSVDLNISDQERVIQTLADKLDQL